MRILENIEAGHWNQYFWRYSLSKLNSQKYWFWRFFNFGAKILQILASDMPFFIFSFGYPWKIISFSLLQTLKMLKNDNFRAIFWEVSKILKIWGKIKNFENLQKDHFSWQMTPIS